MPSKHVIAIDLEMIGDRRLLSVAVVSKTMGSREAKTTRISFPTTNYHGRSVDEFWSKYPALKNIVQRQPKNVQEVLLRHAGFNKSTLYFWLERVSLLEELEKECQSQVSCSSPVPPFVQQLRKLWWVLFTEVHNHKDKQIEWIGDNIVLDFGLLNTLFNLYNLKGFHAMRKVYSPIVCVRTLLQTLARQCNLDEKCTRGLNMSLMCKRWNQPIPTKPSTHNPIDDCLHVIQVYETIQVIEHLMRFEHSTRVSSFPTYIPSPLFLS
jgi:hypothetical protein